jgi:osmoprotectant transport system permease protein
MGPLSLAQDIGSRWVYWPWVGDHLDEIRERLAEHITLTVLAVGFGLVIAFPLALLAARWRRFYAPVIAVTGVLYTIPSLALFVILIPWTGLSRTTALVPLVAYTLLILIRNIVAGLRGVPPEVREAAQGMGYRPLRQLFSVELPLAMPAIVAGIRIATVTTIGLITITALIGQGGLGQFMIDGFQRDFRTPLTVGVVLSIALAVAADLLLVGTQRLLSPWARGDGGFADRRRRSRSLRRRPAGAR